MNNLNNEKYKTKVKVVSTKTPNIKTTEKYDIVKTEETEKIYQDNEPIGFTILPNEENPMLVVETEEAKKKFGYLDALLAASLTTLGLAILTIGVKGYKAEQKNNTQNIPKNDTAIELRTDYKTDTEKEKKSNIFVKNDYGKILYTTPYIDEINGKTVFSAPSGYIQIGNLCYQVQRTQELPEGVEYVAPNGYIVLGNKAVEIKPIGTTIGANDDKFENIPSKYQYVNGTYYKLIDAVLLVENPSDYKVEPKTIVETEYGRILYAEPYAMNVNGEIRVFAPSGYILQGNICYKVEYTKKMPEDVHYQAPSGYILLGDKAVKIAKPKQHINKDGEIVTEIPSEYYSYKNGLIYQIKDAELIKAENYQKINEESIFATNLYNEVDTYNNTQDNMILKLKK